MAAIRSTLTRVGVVLAVTVGAAQAQTIATNTRIDGLQGDSTLKGHENEIALTGHSQSIGTKTCSRVVVAKAIDRSSPGLVSRAASNVTTPQVVITLTRLGTTYQDFFGVTLDQVSFDRIELSEQSDQMVEQVNVAPRHIRIDYRPQLPDGQLGPPITSTIAC